MVAIRKTALVLYSREEMFALVDNVEAYENFLPWCGSLVKFNHVVITEAALKEVEGWLS